MRQQNSKLFTTIFIIISMTLVISLTYNNYIASKIEQTTTDHTITLSHKNATYIINNQYVTLRNGIHETQPDPGSSSKRTTAYFGNEITKDINSDGKTDIIFLLTQTDGGTSTLYYVAAAIQTDTGYQGTHAMYLGDHIAPQTTTSGPNNSIIINYADRKPKESFDIKPSVGKSIWLILDTEMMQFGEWVHDFEGESNH